MAPGFEDAALSAVLAGALEKVLNVAGVMGLLQSMLAGTTHGLAANL